MIIRRKVFSRLWDEETNEEKLFSVNEISEEKLFARGTKEAGKLAKEFLAKKGNKIANKRAKFLNTRHLGTGKEDVSQNLINLGKDIQKAESKGDIKGAKEAMERYRSGLAIPVAQGRKAVRESGFDKLASNEYLKKNDPKFFEYVRELGKKKLLKK